MKTQLNKYLIWIALLALGFIIGKYLMPKNEKPGIKQKSSKTAQQINYPLLNPMLEEYLNNGLDLSELKSFRKRIDDYITKEKAVHPDLKIAYYFRDLNNGLWTGINEQETFAPASLMKIPIMIAVLKKAEREPDILTLGFTYDSLKMGNIKEEHGIKKVHGQQYNMDQMIQFMIEYSDNFASLALMEFIGEENIEKVENDLNIHIKPGYDDLTNFVTVKSYAAFFRILYNSSYLSPAMSQKALEYLSLADYNKGLSAAIPKNIRMAHKYGKRDLEGNNGGVKNVQLHHFGLVYFPGKPYIIGVMTRGNSLAAKEKVIEDLGKITYEEVSKQTQTRPFDRVFYE